MTCPWCHQQMRCERNDVGVLDRNAHTIRWGDLWKCRDCDRHIVAGMGQPLLLQDSIHLAVARSSF